MFSLCVFLRCWKFFWRSARQTNNAMFELFNALISEHCIGYIHLQVVLTSFISLSVNITAEWSHMRLYMHAPGILESKCSWGSHLKTRESILERNHHLLMVVIWKHKRKPPLERHHYVRNHSLVVVIWNHTWGPTLWTSHSNASFVRNHFLELFIWQDTWEAIPERHHTCVRFVIRSSLRWGP